MSLREVWNWVRTGWDQRPLRLDAMFYLLCAAYSAALALTDKHYSFRIWAVFATVGYGVAFIHTCWLWRTPRMRSGWWRSRWVGIGIVAVIGMLAPLATLVIRRLAGGDWSYVAGAWSAQPEVWVIERAAGLLLETGSPYLDISTLDRLPEVHDYTPYGPVMALLGLPRALFGGTAVGDALTDGRLVFALVAVLCAWASLRLLNMPHVPIRAAQLAVVFPLTALTWATAGQDLAIVGLLVLAAALMTAGRTRGAGAVLGLAASAKLIVLPAVIVFAFFVTARQGKKALLYFLAPFITVCAVVNVPVVLRNPAAFVENVLRFPAGFGAVSSPAASPLPGHLLASTGFAGRVFVFALLGTAALAILVWLVRQPPRTGSDALLRVAVGLGAFTLLTPATRFGYLIYPAVLLGAALVFAGRSVTPPGTGDPGSSTTAGYAPLTSS